MFDVLIAGGGPVGWSCALAARQALGGKARVAVVERQAAPALKADAPLSSRVYTVSAGNLDWLEQQGVAFDASRIAPVRRIVVHGLDGQRSLQVGDRDGGRDFLARVIEHETLTEAIADRARALGVELLLGHGVATHMDGDARLLEMADRSLLSSRLLLVADGARSLLRGLAGIESRTHDYPQQGVVAHFECAEPHRGAACQWFLNDGSILALLPLPDIAGRPAVSMVWSCMPAQAQSLLALEVNALLDAVNAVCGSTCQLLAVRGAAQAFALLLVRAADPVGERLLVVGDAAHAVHPLAGQGVNLGLNDARALFDLGSALSQVAGDPGHALLLARYRRMRFAPTLAMQATTDGLFRLYNQPQHPLLTAAGDAGMRLVGRLPAFRRMLSSAATR